MSAQQGTGGVWRVEGNPTATELAAVVAAVTAAASAAASVPSGSRVQVTDVTNGWSAYGRSMRQPLPAGPGAWWASSQPGA